MIYIGKLQKAVNFAIKVHEVDQKQKRKGKDVAYISHPLAVGLILSRTGADEDVVVAGILHDTVEDSIEEKRVTPEILKEEFGERVADIVMSITEDKGFAWGERKQKALEEIKEFSNDSLLLKSADLISNVSEIVDDYGRDGYKDFEGFSAPEPKKENTIRHYSNVMNAILTVWPENPLKEDLLFLSEKLIKI